METFADLVQAVQDDETIGAESTLYYPDLIKRTINRAYINKVASLFPWPEFRDAKKTTTEADQEYYDYPSNWRSLSIWKLKVDGVRYGENPDGSPLSYDDYLNWKEDYPDSTDKKWSNYQRRFFIAPTPSTDGLDICIWGIRIPDKLVSDSDVTDFTYSMPEANEAIVLETVAMLKSKGNEEQLGVFRSAEAKQILAVAWGKIKTEQAKYEKDQPFFDVPDYFAQNGNPNNQDMRGRFNI